MLRANKARYGAECRSKGLQRSRAAVQAHLANLEWGQALHILYEKTFGKE